MDSWTNGSLLPEIGENMSIRNCPKGRPLFGLCNVTLFSFLRGGSIFFSFLLGFFLLDIGNLLKKGGLLFLLYSMERNKGFDERMDGYGELNMWGKNGNIWN